MRELDRLMAKHGRPAMSAGDIDSVFASTIRRRPWPRSSHPRPIQPDLSAQGRTTGALHQQARSARARNIGLASCL